MPEAARPSTRSLVAVLAAVLVTMAAGFALKAPCMGSWADGRQYRLFCYSDVAALYASDDRDRGLDQGRFPYLEGENEYPVLTGLAMGAAAVPARSHGSFFGWSALLLTGAALATGWALHRMAGRRALLFALAPTLALYGLMNWDLLAVALATGATLAYLGRRDGAAGALLGLGAAAKLYPGLLAVPFAVGRLRERRVAAAALIPWAAAAAWLAVNLPFAIAAPARWEEFFRFNSQRGADWDSPWYLAARHLDFTWNPAVLNVLSAASFVVLAAVLWRAAAVRRPGFPAWTFGFPLLVAFLLTSKVYSPQFGLWLLPWFALVLPDLRLFAAFQVADVAVFVTRFSFFAEHTGTAPGLPFWTFEVALLARAAVLAACLLAWVRRPAEEPQAVPAPAMEAA